MKLKLIRENLGQAEGYVVGDTETDIFLGRESNLRTIVVSNGIRSREMLETLNPDHLIENISEITRLIK